MPGPEPPAECKEMGREMAFLGDPQADLAFSLLLDWVDSEGYRIPKLEGTPDTEETVNRYETLTGWKVDNLFYNEVLAAFRAGVVMLKVFKNFKKLRVALPREDIELNNVCTQRLAGLLLQLEEAISKISAQ